METTFGIPLGHEEYMKQRMAEEKQPDLVNNPPHYTHSKDIECIDAIAAALGPQGFAAFCRGNVIKYNWRCDHKGGAEDIAKARWYLDKLLEKERQT